MVSGRWGVMDGLLGMTLDLLSSRDGFTVVPHELKLL